MPRISEFPNYAEAFAKVVKEAGSKVVESGINDGAEYMRRVISGEASTGHPWHAAKNAANGYATGARIGNTVAFKYKKYTSEIDPHAGNMLNSVSSLGPAVNPDGSKIVGLFGWIDPSAEDEYFLQQDTGKYGVGNQVGMGLLNKGNKTSRNMAAGLAAEVAMEKEAKTLGFKVSGGGLF